MNYKIVEKDGKRQVYLPHVPQYLDRKELYEWMVETRDDDPEVYAELVPIFIALDKGKRARQIA